MDYTSMPLKLLALTRYAKLGASSRLRSYQYAPAFAAAGIQVDWSPLFDDPYILKLYREGRRQPLHVAAAYLKRLSALLRSHRYDLVWLEKESLPWLPSLLDPGLLAKRARYIVDYDDAVFHNYDQSASRLVRGFLHDKIDAVMRRAELVVAGNPYLAQRARDAHAPRVEIVPTAIDLDRYQVRGSSRNTGVVVGWIGTPSTQHMIQRLAPLLGSILDPTTDRLVTVGARFEEPLLPIHESRPWTEETEVDEIRRFDIGVMPLVDRPFERGKCGYKLIQYMACGVPVVASPVGVNVNIVRSGDNGFLASSDDEWRRAIATLKADPTLRASMGSAGRALVEEKYCIQVTGPQLVRLIGSTRNELRDMTQ